MSLLLYYSNESRLSTLTLTLMFITKFHSRYKHLYLECSRSEEPVNCRDHKHSHLSIVQIVKEQVPLKSSQTIRNIYMPHLQREGRIIQNPNFSSTTIFAGCGGRIWTYDLRVMSPTSCQTAPPRVRFDIGAVERWDYSKLKACLSR